MFFVWALLVPLTQSECRAGWLHNFCREFCRELGAGWGDGYHVYCRIPPGTCCPRRSEVKLSPDELRYAQALQSARGARTMGHPYDALPSVSADNGR
jgi:hypothetical protein